MPVAEKDIEDSLLDDPDLAAFLTPKMTKYIKEAPTAKQTAFLLLDDVYEVFFGGAAGGGKSSTILMGALQYVDVPDYAALIVRSTYKDLSEPGAIMDRSKKWLMGTDAKWNDKDKIWTFPSGAKLVFGHLDSPTSHYNFQCLTPDHEVLTTNGKWVPIADIKVGDVIATLDPKTRELGYNPVQKTFSYDYSGLLYGVRDSKNHVSFMCTPNHRVWASTRSDSTLIPYRADSLPKTFMVPKWADWNGVEDKTVFKFQSDGHNGHEISFTAEQFAEFLGWYISEGNCDFKQGSRWTVKITQTHQGKGRAKIEALLKDIGLNYWKNDKYFTFASKSLCLWLHSACGYLAKNKKVPDFVFSWSSRLIGIFLNALIDGDGSWYGKRAIFVSSSVTLRDQVTELGIKAGYIVNTADISFTDKTIGKYSYDGVSYKTYLTPHKRRDTLVGNKIKNQLQQFPYNGPVHCLCVKNHTFLIRRNGKISWTGNSAEFQYVAFDEASQLRWNQVMYLHSRIRKKKGMPVPLRFRLASNPGGPSHLELKTRYIDPETRAAGVVFIPSTLDDNPYIDKEEYTQKLNQLDPLTRAQLLHGDWNAAESGELFKKFWFTGVAGERILKEAPTGKTIKRVRFWDLAATEKSVGKDPDWTCGALLSLYDGMLCIEDMVRGRWRPDQVEKMVFLTADRDGRKVPVRMEQEPGSAGVTVIAHYAKKVLMGFDFKGIRSTGNKVEYAKPLSAAAEQGNVRLLGPARWHGPFLDEAEGFPFLPHDDQVDSVSKGFAFLTGKKKRAGVW